MRAWLWGTSGQLPGPLLPDPFAPAFGNTSGIKIQLIKSKHCDGEPLSIWLGLKSPWKHSSGRSLESVPRKVQLRREGPALSVVAPSNGLRSQAV